MALIVTSLSVPNFMEIPPLDSRFPGIVATCSYVVLFILAPFLNKKKGSKVQLLLSEWEVKKKNLFLIIKIYSDPFPCPPPCTKQHFKAKGSPKQWRLLWKHIHRVQHKAGSQRKLLLLSWQLQGFGNHVMSMCRRVLLSHELIKPTPGAFMCSKQPRAELLSSATAQGSQGSAKNKSQE